MSFRNKLRVKATRRAERSERKTRTWDCMRFHGVHVRKTDVLGHRYLARKGLPHSKRLTQVVIHAA
jgi:hypothetical protein